MNSLTRKEFLRLGGVALVAMIVPLSVTSCSGFEPKPFVVGSEVGAPQGCEKLRAFDPKGDC